MNQVKFSIVVPVYNTKIEWLNECIQSLLNQTSNNYEIIIIDDGSNKTIKNYLDNLNNKKVKVIHQENQGIVKSRLNGINKASGEYILHVDSDDFVSPNAIEILETIATKYSTDCILFKSFACHNSVDNIIGATHDFKEGVVEKDEALQQLVSLHINPITDKCVKKHLYENMLSNIDSSIINGEDLQQSTYLILRSNSFYYTESIIEYYRINEENREYYDIKKLNEVNFLVPTYNMVFKDNNKYIHLLDTYKVASYKAILYIAFQICWLKISYNNKKKMLNNLLKQEIVCNLISIGDYPSSIYSLVFKLLTKRCFILIIIISFIFKLKNI